MFSLGTTISYATSIKTPVAAGEEKVSFSYDYKRSLSFNKLDS